MNYNSSTFVFKRIIVECMPSNAEDIAYLHSLIHPMVKGLHLLPQNMSKQNVSSSK